MLSESNLLEVFTKNSLHLLVEQDQDVLTFTDQVEASQRGISLVNQKILDLKGRIQERARQILVAEITDFELEKSENKRISDELDFEIGTLQAEVTRLKSAMDDLRENF